MRIVFLARKTHVSILCYASTQQVVSCRKNISQFDLAYIDVGRAEVLAAFDTCSTATIIHRELIEEGQLEVTETSNNSNINGIGGVAKGRVVAIVLENQNRDKSIMIHATVVDEISTLQNRGLMN